MAKDRDKKADYTEAYNQAWPQFGAWQAEAQRDIRSYLGDIFSSAEKQKLRLRGSDILNIQLIRRLVKWIAGFQSDHRLGIKYDPVDKKDTRAANEFTELVTYVMRRSRGYELISRAFEGALKTGLTLVNVFNDVNLDTRLDHFFYNQFLLDPGFTRLDLQDCRYGIIRKFITKAQAKTLLPQSLHDGVDAIDDERPKSDEKFPNYKTPTIHGRKMIAYDEFQEKTSKEVIFVVDRVSGTETEWQGTRQQLNERLPGLLAQRGVPAELVSTFTRQKETVEVSAFLNSEHFNTEMDPFGLDDFSYTPIWCYYDPEHDQMHLKLQGLVRSLREIQRAESKRIIAEIHWFENSIGAGLDFEKDTLVDMEDAFVTGNAPRMFEKGALSAGAVKDRAMPSFPQGMAELHQVLEDLMPKTIGITPEMLGNVPNGTRAQISGFLTELRIGAGMTGTRSLFDDLGLSQNIVGDKVLKLMQKYPMQKIERILGREPSQALKDHDFGEFDAATAQGALTGTQKNVRYQELLSLIELGAKTGKPFPATWGDVMENSTLQVSEEMLQKIQQRDKQSAQQQQLATQQQNQLQSFTIDALRSTIEMQNAKAIESKSKTVKNLTAAELDEAKSQGVPIDIDIKNQQQLLTTVTELSRIGLEQQKLTQPLQKGGV